MENLIVLFCDLRVFTHTFYLWQVILDFHLSCIFSGKGNIVDIYCDKTDGDI